MQSLRTGGVLIPSILLCLLALSMFQSYSFYLEIDNLKLTAALDGCIPSMTFSPLIQHIKSDMTKPSGSKPNLKNPSVGKGQKNQLSRVLDVVPNKENGFFIEAGAWDGEQLSNTLYLETALGWTGLLVEPNLGVYQQLLGKQRNAHTVNSCLSPDRKAQKVRFDTADVFGGIDDGDKYLEMKRNKWGHTGLKVKEISREILIVQCYPLYSLLLALDNPRVDFFSLDIEGQEMNVLKTIPFDKVDIHVFLVETDKSNVTEMNDFMAGVGYRSVKVPPYDTMYVKN